MGVKQVRSRKQGERSLILYIRIMRKRMGYAVIKINAIRTVIEIGGHTFNGSRILSVVSLDDDHIDNVHFMRFRPLATKLVKSGRLAAVD